MTTEQQLDALIAALPTQIEPAPDSWQQLAQRIATTAQESSDVTVEEVSAPTLGTAVPAAVPVTSMLRQQPAANQSSYWLKAAVAAGIAIVGMLVLTPTTEQQPIAVQSPIQQATVASSAPEALTQATETHAVDGSVVTNQLRGQREKIMAQVGGHQFKRLQQVPAGFENWQQQLAIWQQASGQLEKALQQQPANRRLLKQYQQLQQQQLKYMHKLTALSQAYS